MEGAVHRFLLHLSVVAAISAAVGAEGGNLQEDGMALVSFRSAVAPRGSLSSWNLSNGRICRWHGIKCNRNDKRVTEVHLYGSGLSGNIPFATLGNLTALKVLILHSNALTGALPSDLANLTSLRRLYLYNNDFDGQLTDGMLLGWPKLKRLDLSFNRFHGPVPYSLNNLANLTLLYLQNNSFEGPLPMLNLSSLERLSVAYNRLNGSIPPKSSYSKFQPEAFTGNDLCGYPLQGCEVITPSPAPSPSTAPAITIPPPFPLALVPFLPALVPVPEELNIIPEELNINQVWSRSMKIAVAAVGSVVGLAMLACISILLYPNGRERKGGISGSPSMMRRYRVVHPVLDVKPADGSHSHSQATYSVGMANSVVVRSNLNTWKIGAGKSEELPLPDGMVFFKIPTSGTFTLQELLTAPAVALGHGNAGTVYKASLRADIVVVKRLHSLCMEYPEFKRYVEQMGGLKHENVLQLKAYYYSEKEKLLVYDYMALGSLSSLLLLHGGDNEAKKKPLDWEMRKWLAMGAASGIAYIHEQGLVHGNIKSNNILVSKDYCSCIADFGIIQMKGGMPRNTLRSLEVVTHKADVYNFGIVLLELLTGKPVRSFTDSAGMSTWVEKSRFDPQLLHHDDDDYNNNNGIKSELMRMLHICVWCLASSPSQRPTMCDVVNLINNLSHQ